MSAEDVDKDHVLAIIRYLQEICESTGKPPSTGIVLLFISAGLIAMRHSDKSRESLSVVLSKVLDEAILVAEDWYE